MSVITKRYEAIKGVDFSSEPSLVKPWRSPKMVNMYRDYTGSDPVAITTRKGFCKAAAFGQKIYGMHTMRRGNTLYVFVHSGSTLYLWNNFPSAPAEEDKVELYTQMQAHTSVSFQVGAYLYLLDGQHYLRTDGETVESFETFCYVPTTSAYRTPAGEGDVLQEVNVLTKKRINTFVSDGESTQYYLNAKPAEVLEVQVDGVVMQEGVHYTVNSQEGVVQFNTPPGEAEAVGEANVSVVFNAGGDESGKVTGCGCAIEFDSRIFFAGNNAYPNVLFHSKLNDPTYIADTDYYEEGMEQAKIKFMCVKNGRLYVFCSGQSNALYVHTPQIDYDYGKIYPRIESGVSEPCGDSAINFYDDVVFLSQQGLKGVYANETQIYTYRRSSLIDTLLTRQDGFSGAVMVMYGGYLCVLTTKGRMFLADSRERFSANGSYEYEWFYFEQVGSSAGEVFSEGCMLANVEETLFVGCENGDICRYEGSADDEKPIYCEYNTPREYFSTRTNQKCMNAFGSYVFLRTMPNMQLKVSVNTDKSKNKSLETITSSGFSFLEIDFANFSFAKENDYTKRLRLKEKNFMHINLRFYSDELDRPFGIYTVALSAYESKYTRR